MRVSHAAALLTLWLLQGCVAPVIAASSDTNMITNDRRTPGTRMDDDGIESKSQKRIEEKFKDSVHITVTAYNRFVLLTGTVSSEATKMEIERIVGAVPTVKGIANELVFTDKPAANTAAADARINSNVLSRFSKSPAFKNDHIRVITDSGVVYLMGMVTHGEADAASDIASTTAGVQKVMRVFEYID